MSVEVPAQLQPVLHANTLCKWQQQSLAQLCRYVGQAINPRTCHAHPYKNSVWRRKRRERKELGICNLRQVTCNLRQATCNLRSEKSLPRTQRSCVVHCGKLAANLELFSGTLREIKMYGLYICKDVYVLPFLTQSLMQCTV